MTKEEQFEAFWKSYPRRQGKGAARTAFAKAIKKTTLENMLKAITAYVANKPGYQDYKHPSTWLNGECWDDEWEPQQAKASRPVETRDEYIARAIKANDWDGKPSTDRRVNDLIRGALAK